MKNRNRKNKNGFTLIELVITISMFTILLFIGLTKFNQESNIQNVNTAVQQIAYAIKQARHYTRVNGIQTEVNLNAGSRNYDIKANNASLTASSNFDSTSGLLPEGTKIIESSCPKIFFYVDGTPVNELGEPITSDCKVVVGYNNGVQKTILLKAVSGNVIYEK